MVRAINRKLIRDILAFKGQVAAIAVVTAAGVMVLIFFATALDALKHSRDSFYQHYSFAHIFSEIKRAPETIADRIREIPGTDTVETRIKGPVRLSVKGFEDPIQGTVVSVPEGRQPLLNRVHLLQGTMPEPGSSNQVLVSRPFAQAHGLRAGNTLQAIINGRLETLIITGTAASPEFIYQLGPAQLMPDYKRYAVLWMNRRGLDSAFGMDGAFNNLVLTLQPGADQETVIDAVDHILGPYGSIGAYGRNDQISSRFLQEELNQLRIMAVVLPVIFLGVTAFLLNVLLARIIRTQRQQIALLKAFGYGNMEIGLHFIQLMALIVSIGSVLGIGFGALAAGGVAGLYEEYFQFHEMSFGLRLETVVLAVALAFGAGLLGTLRAVARASAQPPAEAMRPPMPERFARSGLELSFLGRILNISGRMILRNISRHRFKSLMSLLGIGLSCSLLLLGSYQFGSVNHMLDIQYRLVQKMDVHVSFNEPVSLNSESGLKVLPGVHYVETYRSVPVRLVHNRTEYRTSIMGLTREPALRLILDQDYQPVTLPPEGLLMTVYLAEYLGADVGDHIQVEIMEGRRQTLDIPLAGTVEEPIGVSAYMDRQALNRIMREGPAVSGAWLLSDASRNEQLFGRLWDKPKVAGIGIIAQDEANIKDYIQDTVLYFMAVLLLLAGSIAFAVVYNNARIAFAERIRELATLRVLGFTRKEVAWILLGEIGLVTLAAIPLGWILGTGFALLLNKAIATDLFRLPFVVGPEAYAFSAGGVLLASALSTVFIAARLRRMDMVLALKTE